MRLGKTHERTGRRERPPPRRSHSWFQRSQIERSSLVLSWLGSRSGLLPHDDGIAGDIAELRRASRAASLAPASVSVESGPFLGELGRVEALRAHKDDLLGRFRTQPSTLRNSRHVVPMIASRLTTQSSMNRELSPLTRVVGDVLGAVMRLDLNPHSRTPFERLSA
jgi:hypothetical protein